MAFDIKKLTDKARDLAGTHNAKIDETIDKAVKAVDGKTGGKHGEKLRGGAEKLKGAVDKVADEDGRTERPASDRPEPEAR